MADDNKQNFSPTEALFEAALGAAGHSFSADRRIGLLAAFKDFQEQSLIVRRYPMDATTEPSNTFSLLPYLKRPGGVT